MWREHQISLIDTGHVTYGRSGRFSLRVLERAIAPFCAVVRVQPQTEQVWRQERKICRAQAVHGQQDGLRRRQLFNVASRDPLMLGGNPVVMVYPMGAGESFLRCDRSADNESADLDGFARHHEGYRAGNPGEECRRRERLRVELVEKAAEQDDALMNKYFETGELTIEEIKDGIRKGTIARTIVPTFCGTAFKNKGIQPLLNGVIDYLPSPLDVGVVASADNPDDKRNPDDKEPFAGLVFKIATDKHMGKIAFVRIYSGTLNVGDTVLNSTMDQDCRIGRLFRMHANHQEALEEAHAGDIVAVIGLSKSRTGDTICDPKSPIVLESIEFPAPVIAIAIRPASRGDNEKLGNALNALAQEDPTFVVTFDQETSETIIAGMGELHLEIIVDRLRREFGVVCEVGKPEVAYRETIRHQVDGEYKHVKQSGGRGQYAHVCLRIEPQEPGRGFSFVNEVKGGVIPSEYIPAVQKGILKAMESGPCGGFPVVDVRVVVYFGSYHEVDSNEFAFVECARQCFRQLFLKGNPQLLEPVMSVEVAVPEEYMGTATGSICSRRGRVDGMDDKGGNKLVRGFVPLSEMFGYSNAIRTVTQGRGTFTMTFERYEGVPFELAEAIIEKRKKEGKVRG